MHATERDRVILNLLDERGFVSFRELSRRLAASPATLRRDLERLQLDGKLIRVRGGAQPSAETDHVSGLQLQGVPFHENVNRNRAAKEAIGKAASELCRPGDAVIIDGGSTTFQMCPYLGPLGLQVLTNSLHIVSALLAQPGTRVSIPGGVVFREQNIVLDPFDDTTTQKFHASRMFVGAAAVTRHGLMQSDIILVQAERKLLSLADELIVLVDSSKFQASAAHLLCELSHIHALVTDDGIDDEAAAMLERAGIKLITVDIKRNGK
ncbi:MAG: DeoR/GlpR transcriptional regulator [Alphaproteobacteria bacterium]|nr:DeoR/GlpR transcriptional regulator [Alphaproteobacteria bacterium]MDE1987645.1 DeoR/GlpR transcriptional regulator [Alphaproteobacteria bacterium]MDE2164631.1 DeoR/GlpR transcriptional regulator [Alphaproteobacteria bacterium]MDE2266244.1 DeoR/GlpR transcriptional regulator [Alphaproteobacteria bacterium]MDE2499438.1 DeoR/GlpR transcriptional regulator [Alphaproteobacteria bacterium]